MTYRVTVLPTTGASGAVREGEKELVHWLSRGCSKSEFCRTRSLKRANFVLGTFDDLPQLLGSGLHNDRWVDEIVIRSIDGKLVLSGSNPRSVLFAVYTYLDSLGFTWIVPGPDGEIVPKLRDIPLDGYAVQHRASLIHRGFALAGAFDVEMIEEFVEWMARNRFNHLFIEGDIRRSSFEWAMGRRISMPEARRYNRRLLRAVRQRGLSYEKMGHGWTRRVLEVGGAIPRSDLPPFIVGFDAAGNPVRQDPAMLGLSEQKRRMTAEIAGVRGLRRNTHLCLSNPQSNRQVTEQVCEYARTHPEIDVLGVWLADGFNNWCECSKCARHHPSDLWVRLINRIARAVHRVRPEMMIEVLGYSVLMESPPTERIDNSRGNVILMYAPFLRCYLHTLDAPGCVSDTPLHTFPPVNRLHHPMNAEYFRFFEGWRERFEGTNYVFDYYQWLPLKRDFFEGNVPRTLCFDLKSYPSHGITGMVDCSRAQSFFPTPLGRWLQGRASWDASVIYAKQRRHLLELAYGEHAGLVDRYLVLCYQCLLPVRHGREEERRFSRAKVRRFKRSLPRVRRGLERAVSGSRGARRKFLKRVLVHADFTLLHLDYLLAEASGQYEKAVELVRRMYTVMQRNRRVLKGSVDLPEVEWLRNSSIKRLRGKMDGTYKRID